MQRTLFNIRQRPWNPEFHCTMSRRFMELKVLLAQVSQKPLFWETQGEGDANPPDLLLLIFQGQSPMLGGGGAAATALNDYPSKFLFVCLFQIRQTCKSQATPTIFRSTGVYFVHETLLRFCQHMLILQSCRFPVIFPCMYTMYTVYLDLPQLFVSQPPLSPSLPNP